MCWVNVNVCPLPFDLLTALLCRPFPCKSRPLRVPALPVVAPLKSYVQSSTQDFANASCRVMDGPPHMVAARNFHQIIAVMPPPPHVHKSVRQKTDQRKSSAHLIAFARECRRLLPAGLCPFGPTEDGECWVAPVCGSTRVGEEWVHCCE